MKTWFGSLIISPQVEPREATVLATENGITIGFRRDDGVTERQHWELKELLTVYDPSMQSTRINRQGLPGYSLVIAGKQALEYIEELQAEQSKPWHRKGRTKEWGRNILILLGIASVLVAAYFLIVPWMSEKLASTISVQTEARLGNAVYDALDLTGQEDREASAVLNEFFRELNVQTPYTVQITVVKSDIVNAYALPGGHIVVYTALLQELRSYPELAALLSHEFTHVNNRHSTKSIFRQLGSRVFLGLLFGKFGSVTSVMVDQADRFKSLRYSRGLEKEADLDGLALLNQRRIDPEGFIGLFQHLKDAAPPSAMPEFLGSHPDIDKRIRYIREASKNSSIEHNPRLTSIFEKLK